VDLEKLYVLLALALLVAALALWWVPSLPPAPW
jgi:hypothetical protein